MQEDMIFATLAMLEGGDIHGDRCRKSMHCKHSRVLECSQFRVKIELMLGAAGEWGKVSLGCKQLQQILDT
jgi:hypothetical protein